MRHGRAQPSEAWGAQNPEKWEPRPHSEGAPTAPSLLSFPCSHQLISCLRDHQKLGGLAHPKGQWNPLSTQERLGAGGLGLPRPPKTTLVPLPPLSLVPGPQVGVHTNPQAQLRLPLPIRS